MSDLAAPLPRHKTVPVRVGDVTVGGGAPVVVQSMTNTDTADVEATAGQVAALARAGSELVRITVDRDEAAAAVPHIKERLLQMGEGGRPKQRRIMELNPQHEIFNRMVARFQQNKNEVELGKYADLLLSYALLAEGSDLPDPVGFNQLVAELMIQTLSNDAQSPG